MPIVVQGYSDKCDDLLFLSNAETGEAAIAEMVNKMNAALAKRELPASIGPFVPYKVVQVNDNTTVVVHQDYEITDPDEYDGVGWEGWEVNVLTVHEDGFIN